MHHRVINGASVSYATTGPTLTEQIDAIMVLDMYSSPAMPDIDAPYGKVDAAALQTLRETLRPLEMLRPKLGKRAGEEGE